MKSVQISCCLLLGHIILLISENYHRNKRIVECNILGCVGLFVTEVKR